MIHLIAFTPADGWAVAREGDRWWHLQPPYRRADRRLLADRTAARALMEQGYTLRDEVFSDWGSLTRALVQETVRALGEQDRKASVGAWRAVLRRTTTERARQHLATLQEWVDAGDGASASRILPILLAAPAVAQDPGLVADAAALLERIEGARQRRPPSVGTERTDWPVDDPEGLRAVQEGYARLGGFLDFRQSA